MTSPLLDLDSPATINSAIVAKMTYAIRKHLFLDMKLNQFFIGVEDGLKVKRLYLNLQGDIKMS